MSYVVFVVLLMLCVCYVSLCAVSAMRLLSSPCSRVVSQCCVLIVCVFALLFWFDCVRDC